MFLIIDFPRYNEELTQVFMSCNLMGGMFQRLGKGTLLQIEFIFPVFLYWKQCCETKLFDQVTKPGLLVNLDPLSNLRF
jgi:hypothetical protein